MVFSRKKKEPNPYLEDEDVRLMLAFKKGDAASFETLLKKYFPQMMNFIYRYVGDRTIAEDIAQEVFIRVYRKKDMYTPKARFKTWLYTIARNLSINELRKRKLEQKLKSLEALKRKDLAVLENAEGRDMKIKLFRAIRKARVKRGYGIILFLNTKFIIFYDKDLDFNKDVLEILVPPENNN